MNSVRHYVCVTQSNQFNAHNFQRWHWYTWHRCSNAFIKSNQCFWLDSLQKSLLITQQIIWKIESASSTYVTIVIAQSHSHTGQDKKKNPSGCTLHFFYSFVQIEILKESVYRLPFTHHMPSETSVWIPKYIWGRVSNGKEQSLLKGFTTLKENSLLALLGKHFTVEANQKVFEWGASVIPVLQPAQSDSPCARLKRILLWVCFPYQRAAENRALWRTALLCIITTHCASLFVTAR